MSDTRQSIDAEAGMKVALTVLALAALPFSAWLYITDYVEETVDETVERQQEIFQRELEDHERDLELLRSISRALCRQVRDSDLTFSCFTNIDR